MKKSQQSIRLVACCVAFAFTACALAQDWPQWRGANRDAKASGFKAPKTWPKELTQKWKTAVGGGDASPAVVGDKVYVFARQDSDEIVRCLDAGTGKEVWQEKYAAPSISGPDAGIHSGPRSSPAVAEGKIVTLGVCGTLSCVDAASGKKLWRKDDFPDAWPRFHTAMSPLIVDGLCVAQLGKENEGAIVAYDLGSGEQKWKWTGEGPGYASPAVLTLGNAKVIVTQTSKSVVGIGAKDGKALWQAAFAPQGMAYNACTPIVDGQTVVYSGSGRGTRAMKLEMKGGEIAATEIWNNPEQSVQFNSPILKNGLVYGLSARDNLFCISEKGQTAWTAPSGGKRGFGSLVDAGAVLLALTPASQLLVFEPSDKEFKQLASYKVADSDTYAYPVTTSSGIYIKDKDSLSLWAVE
jgi:outer membrane protein assembly factor BamB